MVKIRTQGHHGRMQIQLTPILTELHDLKFRALALFDGARTYAAVSSLLRLEWRFESKHINLTSAGKGRHQPAGTRLSMRPSSPVYVLCAISHQIALCTRWNHACKARFRTAVE